MGSNLSSAEIAATSQELVEYYNILKGNPPGTPQEPFIGVQPWYGRTATYEKILWDENLVKKVILFKRATREDLENRPDDDDWSKFIATGPITSLNFKTRGAPLPDITTKISAERKKVDTIRGEITVAYYLLQDLKHYIDDREFAKNAKPSKILRGFLDYQYGIKDSSSERLEYEPDMEMKTNHKIPVKVIWQENSTVERYGAATNYLEILVKTPDIHYAPDKTKSVIRINNRNPLNRVEAALNEHLNGLQQIYVSRPK